MTPTFMGSELVKADSGKYAGTVVLQDEQNKGLALMQALTPAQQDQARLEPGAKAANKSQEPAYRDNLQLPYAGSRRRQGPVASALREARPRRRARTQAALADQGQRKGSPSCSGESPPRRIGAPASHFSILPNRRHGSGAASSGLSASRRGPDMTPPFHRGEAR